MQQQDILRIDVAGLPIFGRPATGRTPSGLYLGPDGFTGWTGGPSMRRDVVQRVLAAGDFDAPGNLDSRTATFSGVCVTPSAGETDALGDRLTGLLADGRSGQVTVQATSKSQYGQARRAGETQFDVRGRTPRIADWQLQLWFPDPRKFGEFRLFPASAGATVGVSHRGNFGASPVVDIAGAMPGGYTLFGPAGKTYAVTAPVTASAPHQIDLHTGLLRIAGATRYGVTTSADTWVIPPGQVVSHRLVPASGTGSFVVGVPDTYI
jgi:hypothetical protein